MGKVTEFIEKPNLVADDELLGLRGTDDNGIRTRLFDLAVSVANSLGITNIGSGKIITDAERLKVQGLEPGAEVNQILSYNGRIGDVAPQAGDYEASEVNNDSGVTGGTVAAALDQLNSDKMSSLSDDGSPQLGGTLDFDGQNTIGNAIHAGTHTFSGTVSFTGAVVFPSPIPALDIGYNGVAAGLVATNVQDAIDEVVDGLSSLLDYQGGYDANTNTPDLVTPIAGAVEKGYAYTVTVAGTFFTANLEAGDLLISEVDDPAAEADWTIVNRNVNSDDITGTVTVHSDVDATTTAVFQNNLNAAVDPIVTDDSASGYAVGSRWFNTTADSEFICLDASVGAAVWKNTISKKIHVATIDDNGVPFTTTSGTFEMSNCFIYNGGVDDLQLVQVNAYMENAATEGEVRIWDITNSLQVAIASVTSLDPLNVQSMTITPANIPAGQAVFEVQVRQSIGGGGDDFYTSSVMVSM